MPEDKWMLINGTHSVKMYKQMYIILYPEGPLPLKVSDEVFDGKFYGYYRNEIEAKNAIDNHHNFNIRNGEVL